jgi:hypothetical protein
MDLLPDEILVQILALLPLSSMIRASGVCYRFAAIIRDIPGYTSRIACLTG